MTEIFDRPESPPTPTRLANASTDFLPNNPFRPPDWRWQRAGQLVETRARRRRQDDDWVVKVRRFRAGVARAGGDVRRPRLARAHPEILNAYLINHGEPRRRSEVEARLLAGQGDGEIAGRLGVGAGVIRAYEALYYDVRSRRAASDWVSACVLGGRLYEGFDVDDIEVAWKIVAYQCGSQVLDAMIENLRGDGRPPTDPMLAEQLKLLIAVAATPVTPENALDFCRLDSLMRDIERAEAARSVAAVTRSIVIPPIDVHFGPETVLLLRAGCAPDDPNGAEAAVRGGPIELSDVG